MLLAVLVAGNFYSGVGSVQYVPQNGNDSERKELTTNKRINSGRLSNMKISHTADSADSNVNHDIPTAINASIDVAKSHIARESKDSRYRMYAALIPGKS